jgi:hypothetical protein
METNTDPKQDLCARIVLLRMITFFVNFFSVCGLNIDTSDTSPNSPMKVIVSSTKNGELDNILAILLGFYAKKRDFDGFDQIGCIWYGSYIVENFIREIFSDFVNIECSFGIIGSRPPIFFRPNLGSNKIHIVPAFNESIQYQRNRRPTYWDTYIDFKLIPLSTYIIDLIRGNDDWHINPLIGTDLLDLKKIVQVNIPNFVDKWLADQPFASQLLHLKSISDDHLVPDCYKIILGFMAEITCEHLPELQY